ncbi:MAG: hypothetical protein V1875_01445 [Candidatus Altiarchaeota archaeon]
MNSRRGQAFSADLVVGVVLSILALGLLSAAWGIGKVRLDETEHMRALEDKANRISNLLVKSPGIPPDWEDDVSNVSVLGLAGSDRRLSEGKVEALKLLGEPRLRELFMMGGTGCVVRLRTPEGAIIKSTGNLEYSDSVVTSARIVSFRNQTMFLEVSVWEDRPGAMI